MSGRYAIFIILAFVIGISIASSIASVQGISPFSELGNLEMEVLDAINAIIIELMVQTERIDSLNSTQISEQAEQDGAQTDITNLQGNQVIIFSSLTTINSNISNLEGDVTVASDHIDDHHNEGVVTDTQITGLDARLFALENKQFATNIDLTTIGSTNGFVSVRFISSILFHGDTLCEIEQFLNEDTIYIEFGSNATVKHIDNCVTTESGTLISLESGTTENFIKGDILILARDSTTGFFTEVFRE